MTTNKRILLIDGEERVRQVLRLHLKKNHFDVIEAKKGNDGFQKAFKGDFHIILLDVKLPDSYGFNLCKSLQKTTSASIIILTEEGSEEMRIQGLEAGVDDYIVKPFNPREVVLRIKAILRRIEAQKNSHPAPLLNCLIQLPSLTINLNARRVTVNHQEIRLRPKEYDLLRCLAASPGKVYSREVLLEEVWGYQTSKKGLRTVDPHIKRLRDKICSISQKTGKMIVTVWGEGYKLEVSSSYFLNDEKSEKAF